MSSISPDLILYGGKIATMDAGNRFVEALAVHNGRVVAVGSDNEIKGLRGPATNMLGLEGQTAIPGIIEKLRQESGATLILNADQVLASEPAIDLTDRAIELFDTIGPRPQIPKIDLTIPVTELVNPDGNSEN